MCFKKSECFCDVKQETQRVNVQRSRRHHFKHLPPAGGHQRLANVWITMKLQQLQPSHKLQGLKGFWEKCISFCAGLYN